MPDPIIKLEDVNFCYNKGQANETWALKGINLEIYPGEYVAFFGPSGSGKTSLLYLLSGVEQSQDGKILIHGKDIAKFTTQELAIYRQVGVGMIFQQFNLLPNLTVAQNVALPMAFLGISEDKRKKEAMRLLERLAITNFANRYPHQLSGGQQQRVGIARALANNPPLIIADEPLGNLDSENSNRVLAFLKELNETDNRTIIMVTHEAWSLRDAQRIFYIKDGAVIKTEKATPKNVTKSVTEHLFGDEAKKMEGEKLAGKMLSFQFMQGYSMSEANRFEELLKKRMNGEWSAADFRDALDRPFKEGGLGLWKQKAKTISAYIEDVMKRRKRIEYLQEQFSKQKRASVETDVHNLRAWLLSKHKTAINPLQAARFDEVLEERLRNIVPQDAFRKVLELPQSKNGIGFSFRVSETLAERLDLVLGSIKS